MYTFNRVIKDEKDVSKRRRVVLIEFKDEKESVLERDMQFSIDATDLEVKRAFKAFLDELNFIPIPITDLNVPIEENSTPTQAELSKAEWETNWTKLQTVDKLIAAQILTGVEAPVVALRKKVKDDFKVTYLV